MQSARAQGTQYFGGQCLCSSSAMPVPRACAAKVHACTTLTNGLSALSMHRRYNVDIMPLQQKSL